MYSSLGARSISLNIASGCPAAALLGYLARISAPEGVTCKRQWGEVLKCGNPTRDKSSRFFTVQQLRDCNVSL